MPTYALDCRRLRVKLWHSHCLGGDDSPGNTDIGERWWGSMTGSRRNTARIIYKK
jgi:hypothetical protein